MERLLCNNNVEHFKKKINFKNQTHVISSISKLSSVVTSMHQVNKKVNENNKDKILVSIVLSESTTSLLNLSIPHLDHESSDTSIESSNICVTKSDSFIYKNEDSHKNEGSNKYWYDLSKTKKMGDVNEICSDIAFFSEVMSDSDHSCEKYDDLSDNSLHENMSTFMKPIKVYTRPLVALRSLAHSSRIKSDRNNIFVSALESELTMTESGWLNVCRICHGGESVGDLLSPCRCRGSVALTHIACLERWLKESNSSRCELCQHHYEIIRNPKYSVPLSVLLFLRHPGDHFKELLIDFVAFLIYTPTAICSTYMLMLLCESITQTSMNRGRGVSAHFLIFAAIFGMAAIDFTFSSWLICTFQRHYYAWKDWFRTQCDIKVIVPKRKQHKHRNMNKQYKQ